MFESQKKGTEGVRAIACTPFAPAQERRKLPPFFKRHRKILRGMTCMVGVRLYRQRYEIAFVGRPAPRDCDLPLVHDDAGGRAGRPHVN